MEEGAAPLHPAAVERQSVGMRRKNLHLVHLDPARHYPPHLLVSDHPEPLRIQIDLSRGEDARLLFRDHPHAAVAYVMSSTYRVQAGLRSSYYPLVAFAQPPEGRDLLAIFNCCKWSDRLLDSDWEADRQRYRVYGCRLTEHYLLEFIYRLYRCDGFVIPGHLGADRSSDIALPFHIDVAEGGILGIEPDTVAEIRRHYARDLCSAVATMSAAERASWGIELDDELDRMR